jgi:hypothetical protein
MAIQKPHTENFRCEKVNVVCGEIRILFPSSIESKSLYSFNTVPSWCCFKIIVKIQTLHLENKIGLSLNGDQEAMAHTCEPKGLIEAQNFPIIIILFWLYYNSNTKALEE